MPSSARPGKELKAVAPRVSAEEPPHARQLLVPLDRHPSLVQSGSDCAKLFGIGKAKRRMRLPSRCERLLNADVELMVTDSEPDTTSPLQARGLLQLVQPEQPPIEGSGLRLASLWCRELYVVELWLRSHDLN